MKKVRVLIGCTAVLACVLATASLVRPLSQAFAGRIEMADMTWVQVRTAIADGYATVIVPSGGVEQNGEHMVLAKHDYIVRANAREIAGQLGRTLVAPVISFVPEGDPDHPDGNLAFPGTIGLRASTFESVLEDVAESLRRTGFKTICFIADHGQSLAPQRAVAARLTERWKATGVRVLSIDEYYADEAQRRFLLSRGETPQTMGEHAGMQDTSELMSAHPDGVDFSMISAGAALREASGSSGDPRRSTPEIGREMLALKVKAAVERIRREVAY